MRNRWSVLAVLFAARTAMAFQFQSAAALSPFLSERYGVGLADIGLLIGLYLSPGMAIALPGGAIGRKLGDKAAVAAGMTLMLAGGLAAALLPDWTAQVAGRLVAGLGGVLLNVLMTKMVADWFAGRELSTAMGLFVNSWPIGIALALLVLPTVCVLAGLEATAGLIAAVVALGLGLFLLGYRPPPTVDVPRRAKSEKLRGAALASVLIAGAIWGLYNAAIGMIFGFAPAMLAERGWTPAEAGVATSLALWTVALSVPLGGWIADRVLPRDGVLLLGLVLFALVMSAVPATPGSLALFIALGAVGGLPAGPVMSLPAIVLRPEHRAFGMGVFFTLFYVAIFLAPVAAGALADAAGGAWAVFPFGAALLAACVGLLGLFRAMAARALNRAAPAW